MVSANTASLVTDFNVSPYYDDFSEDKNFHRVLFRPGLAVQARELTQMQTIQQNQVDRFAEHIFGEGSTVSGLEMNYDRNIKYVKIRDADQNATAVTPSAFIGSTVTGATSGVTAYVVDALSGSEAENPNTKTLYIRYTGAGSLGTTAAFVSGEVLTSNTALSANVVTEGVQASNVTGTGSRISFGTGVIYAKDHFIRVDSANTIVGRYTANTDYKIGYSINESIVTSAVDTTLLDPAQGAYNYAAPGADRLKLTAAVTKKLLTDTNDANFVERVRLKNGNPEFQADKPVYSVINEYIARRTYDESGDYIVNGLTTRIREHLNSANNGGVYTSGNGGDIDKLSVDVSPGKAYVRGFEIENLVTNRVTIDKGIDVNSVESISVPANYGNYTVVNELIGRWDVNGHDRVDLYDTAVNAISNNSFTVVLPSAVGTKIGEARVRAVEYNSGSKGASSGAYSMYLYDINMSANSFSHVRSIYYNDGTTDGIADTVLTANNSTIQETSFNRALFNIPASNIKTLRNTSDAINNEFRFLKEFPVTIAADGTVTITTGSVDEQYPFSTGALNNTQERENFLVVLEAAANTATTLETTAARAASANTITGLTSATSKYNVGDVLKIQGEANTYVVSSVDSATQVSVHGNGEGVSISNATLFKAFQPGQVISLNGVGGDAAARGVTINSTTSATIDIQETLNGDVAASVIVELKKVDGQEKAKVINKNRYVQVNISGSGTTTGPWNLGVGDGFALKEVRVKTGNTAFTTTSEGTDVTNQFELDTGMRDNFYDHTKLKLKSSATHPVSAGNVYLTKFDYFTHDTSQGIGYFSVDSYPIDDANSANTTAISTAEIPIYASPTTGTRYDLRDHIDIRPLIANTCAPTTSLPSPTNPSTSTSIVEPSGGLHFMAPNNDYISDFDYYLPRKDRIVITSTGQFRVVRGVPNLIPQTPQAPSDGMTIGVVNVKPYPSLPQENAGKISTATAPNGRADLAIKVEPTRIRRFTMKDIQGLESRIDNLEYYTSLSLLESDTKNLFLADSSGADRFKNGIIVDQFVDFTSSDFYDEGFKVAIDKPSKELRPSFKLDDVQLNFISADSTNVTATSKDATITITSSTEIYTVGETVTQGAASGILSYQVGTKLYLEQVSGTFTTAANVVGSTSTATSAVSTVSTPNAGKLIMLPWTHDETISQPFATDTRNAAGTFYTFHGKITLTPDTDYWNDTTTVPSVTVDFGFLGDAIAEVANHVGINWGDWNSTGSSRGASTFSAGTFWTNWGTALGGITESFTTTTSQQRTGAQLVVNAGNIRQTNLGDSVQNVNLIPYMRSRIVNFKAEGLKPSTRVYAFFDNSDVNSYVSPANASFANTASEGSALLTDGQGILYGNFRIPNDNSLKFPVGNIKLELSDSPTNSKGIGATTTFADATYSAGGLDVVTQGTIISTRDIEVLTRSVTDNRTVSSTTEITTQAGGDPIAQTFRVSDGLASTTPGAYLSKIDLYFASKDTTQGVAIEIRECDPSSSNITPRVVPFSRVIIPAVDINVSTDSTAATPIIFETPVYLLNGVDYAITIKPVNNNPNVTVWTARLGRDDLVTGNRVTQQPASGILFASANDRAWTALQEEDLKFKMYFANFSTNQTGVASFKNTDKEYFTIDNKDTSNLFNLVGEEVHGETTLTLSAAPGGITIGDTIVGSTSSANGTVTNVSGTNIRVKEVTTGNKFTNSETVTLYKAGIVGSNTATVSSQATPTGKVYFFDATTQANTMVHLSAPSGSFSANTYIRGQINGLDARIATVDNLKLDVFQTFMSKLELQDTTASMTAKLATGPSTLDGSFRKVNINADTSYDARRYVLSRSNEIANLSSVKSGQFIATLTNGANVRHSPAIDNDRAAVFTIENLINNDATNEDSTSNGNAIARYIQKTVTLADGQDAEDLKVFLTAYKPSTATVGVYVKLLNGEDGQDMTDKPWISMTQVTSATVVSDSENTNDFREFEYSIPTSYLTGSSNEVQYTDSNGVTYTGFKRFKVKMVLLSSTPSRVPRIKDFRAIALQI
jgi:hypothetical protein